MNTRTTHSHISLFYTSCFFLYFGSSKTIYVYIQSDKWHRRFDPINVCIFILFFFFLFFIFYFDVGCTMHASMPNTYLFKIFVLNDGSMDILHSQFIYNRIGKRDHLPSFNRILYHNLLCYLYISKNF